MAFITCSMARSPSACTATWYPAACAEAMTWFISSCVMYRSPCPYPPGYWKLTAGTWHEPPSEKILTPWLRTCEEISLRAGWDLYHVGSNGSPQLVLYSKYVL